MITSMAQFKLWILNLIIKTRKHGRIFYINGPDILPAPLEKEKEREYIERLSLGDITARKVLIEHNLRLVVYIARKFENTKIGMEDLVSIGTIGLIKAINTFKADKEIKLATYASRCIENEILMFLRKNVYYKKELSLDEPLNVDWDGNELLLSDVLGASSESVDSEVEKEAEKSIVNLAVNELRERDKKIIEMRFGLNGKKEQTQKDVADSLGISQSYISRLEKKIIDKLKNQIEM